MILKIKINYYYHYEKMAGYWIFSSIETLILEFKRKKDKTYYLNTYNRNIRNFLKFTQIEKCSVAKVIEVKVSGEMRLIPYTTTAIRLTYGQ
jgi:hypothetical protein